MAHTCPECGVKCYCRQGEKDRESCIHCEIGNDWDYEEDSIDEYDEDDVDVNHDSRYL